MDWQTPEDTVPSAFITEANSRSVAGKPPASGAWREGDPAGGREFLTLGAMTLERKGRAGEDQVHAVILDLRDKTAGIALVGRSESGEIAW